MMKQILDSVMLQEVVGRALAEDIGPGDVTTAATVPADAVCRASLIAKEAGVICGLPVFCHVFASLDSRICVELMAEEGGQVDAGTILARLDGPARSILTGERTALNFLQHLSGIASRTRQAVEAVAGTHTRITDTRKTTPGLRALEKYAVRTGGATNHRFNLADGILIKDNHIRAAGSISQAVSQARLYAQHLLRIEVEVETMDQLVEALESGADVIMLDNMDLSGMQAAVARVGGRALTEASGNMGDRDLASIARTGVDLISIGALTHSVRAMDISLRFDWPDIWS